MDKRLRGVDDVVDDGGQHADKDQQCHEQDVWRTWTDLLQAAKEHRYERDQRERQSELVCPTDESDEKAQQGDVRSANHLELAAKAVVIGNVYYNLIEMVMGSEVNGNLMHISSTQQDAKRLGTDKKKLPFDKKSLQNSWHC